ncbi:MAG: NAD(P)-dependent oxidoreductase [Vulcanimicrobiaceae bacterium]
MAHIAWLGAGMMGAGFVEGLRRRGEAVTVWNRTAAKAIELERFGATAVGDPIDAVRGAKRVHVILSDDAAVDALLDQLVGAIPSDAIVVDHTTTAPRPTAARIARCPERGIAYLHAPVFMSPQGCRDGTGLMLVAGPRERYERVADPLRKMTGDLWYVGERGDKAAVLKLVGNQMLLFTIAGLGDALALARSADVEPADAIEVFAHFNVAAGLQFRGKKLVHGDLRPSFELSMARKDARLMLETASAGGVELAVLPEIARRMDRFLAAGFGDDDVCVIATDLPSSTAATSRHK